jgi:streptothricin acetyltransferase
MVYAIIDDIAVDRPCRRLGIGKALVHRAIAWAKHRRLPGLMLETQTNNVPACALYERCGFTLGGFDEWLYRALHPKTTEAALFWYLPLRNAGA